MSAQRCERGAKQDIQISVGIDLSTVVIGGAKVEVASDGKKVTAYTNEGVETKAADTGAVAAEGTQISINKEFNAVVLNGVTIERSADGHLVISAPGGTVITKPAPANDTANNSTEPELYSVMPAGHSHAGWIYMGPSRTTGAPFYAASEDAGVFNFNKAASVAAKQGARLCSDKELDQMIGAKDKGALKGTFNVSGSHPAGWYGTDTELPGNPDYVWNQRASDRPRDWHHKSHDSSWRFVRS